MHTKNNSEQTYSVSESTYIIVSIFYHIISIKVIHCRKH